MSIWNLGSINVDLVYRVPHLPQAGETLAATGFQRGLGGKGANMSVAAARAGARCVHLGAVGRDGRWTVERLMEYGVDTRLIAEMAEATGHAIIAVDESGENSIILHSGANRALDARSLADQLEGAADGDWFVTQNETNAQQETAQVASRRGMKVAYAAAPFEADAVRAVLPVLDLLILNAVEAAQLARALGVAPGRLPVRDVVITKGSKGSVWIETDTGTETTVPALPVEPVDTTGAGDTFTGYLLAGRDRGMPMEQALRLASKAAALMVTRHGTADVIPDLKDVQDMTL
ncbi:ribokinase [Cognatishimia sp. F0-27]|uniref:ribokinase n=1 Tax=Cognatishimia sp. F0-27 TaxID=2816855 RepID=UPI001D0CC162|nr:ribokinase [Cognatishimia sp. F0-27]MCC1492464.1 ribokinase [Cognatishimia sp. F0-27]